MKKVFRILILFLVISLVMSFSENDLGKAHLKGRVKSMTHNDYLVKWDSVVMPRIIFGHKEVTWYDTAGNLLLSEIYSSTRNLWWSKSVFRYDDKGLLIERKLYRRGSANDSILIDYVTYIYDNLGSRIKHDSISNGRPTYTIIKTMDQLHDSVIWIPSKIVQMPVDTSYKQPVTTYKYDKKGRKRERLTIGIQGDKLYSKYDKKGRLTETGSYLPDGSLIGKNVFSTDKHGNSINKGYDAKGLVDITIRKFTYDKIGNWVVDSTFSNDTLTYIRTQQFEYY